MLGILLNDKRWAKALLFVGLLLATVTAEAQFTSVTLAWDANQEPDLAGYRLYYGTYGSDPTAVEVPIGAQPSITIELNSDTTYLFYVTAYNTAGLESDPSETITYTTPNVGGPRLALQKSTGGGMTVSAHGTSGNVYVLQAKNDLDAPQWTTIDSATAGTDGSFTLVDPVADLPRRFYRLLQQ